MFKVLRRWWKYMTAKLSGSFNERADPKVQLEQAIAKAQAQHKRLKEQATNVIAAQKQGELRLNAKMSELEKLNANARQALIMAADAQKAGDAERAARMTSAAETIATQLIQVEKDVGDLKALVLQSTQASDQAKAAVQQNSVRKPSGVVRSCASLTLERDNERLPCRSRISWSLGRLMPIGVSGPESPTSTSTSIASAEIPSTCGFRYSCAHGMRSSNHCASAASVRILRVRASLT